MGIYTSYPDSIYETGAGGGGGDGGTAVIGGRTYRTVVIGGKEWLAENLDLKFIGLRVGVTSGSSSTESRGNYYNNDEFTYGITGNKYGLLYNWIAVNYIENNKSSLIPGWHIPTSDEWDELATAVGGASVAGTKLKSSTEWSSGAGTDNYGFSAFPSGYYYGIFGGLGTHANFWTATEYDSGKAAFRGFTVNPNLNVSNPSKADQYSVRIVKDSA